MKTPLTLLFTFIWIASSQAKEGVILLHGLCRNHSSMNKMEDRLSAEGYQVYNASYPSRTASIEKLSKSTIEKALKELSLKKCHKIHFVTHSLGGILVRQYFSEHQDPKLGRVVMLGPPNQGSEVVDSLKHWKTFQKLNGPAGGELGTGKNSTPNKLGKVQFELGVIAGNKSINWINSSIIPGADDGKVSTERAKVEGMKDFIVLNTTHPFMMKNNQVIAQTTAFLKKGTFQR